MYHMYYIYTVTLVIDQQKVISRMQCYYGVDCYPETNVLFRDGKKIIFKKKKGDGAEGHNLPPGNCSNFLWNDCYGTLWVL